jgi:AraC family transcriptional regulator
MAGRAAEGELQTDSRSIPVTLPATSHVRILDSDSRSDLLRVILQSYGPGLVETQGLDSAGVAIHVGRPIRLECRHGDESHIGLAIHGDIDILPPSVTLRREMKETDTELLLHTQPELLRRVASESGLDIDAVGILSRFQIRDAQIEHIGWALMAEVEQDYPNGRLYIDSLATALAVQLLSRHSSASREGVPPKEGLSEKRLKRVLSYIEDNLERNLSLEDIAAEAELSTSHLKALFRKSMGIPLHQYVIRQRVERAATLLREGRLPISQIARQTGFAHQSHLAMHMRRIFGVSPREFRSARGSERDTDRESRLVAT